MIKLSTNKSTQFLIYILAAVLSFGSTVSYAQTPKGTVKGKVINAEGKAADNVTVSLKSTGSVTVTGEDGIFSLKAPAGNYKLSISHVGMQTKEVDVEITAGKTTVVNDLTISLNSSGLQEVTVKGDKVNRFKRKVSTDVAKMPLANLENAQSYTSISRELLTEQNLFTADEAVKNVSGLQKMWDATGRGGDGGSYYTLRGFVVQTQLRNGVAGNVTNSIDAINLDRIEVIKGPSATLFGSAVTSYGGLINRVTKQPFDNTAGEITYTGGSYGLSRVSADVNTPLDAQKKVLFRLNTAYTNQNSFQDNGFSKSVAVAPSLLYRVSDKLSFQAEAELFFGRNALNTFYFFPYGQTIAQLGVSRADDLNIDYTRSYYDKSLSQRSRSANYFAQMNYKISNSWKSTTSFTSASSFSNGFGPYLYLISKDSVSLNDQSTRNSKSTTTEVQQNFNGDFKIGKMRNRMVIGLDYYHVNSNQFFFGSSFGNAPLQSSTFNYSNFNKANFGAIYDAGNYGFTYPLIYTSNTYSAYVSDVFNITDRLIASAALRVDRFDYTGVEDASTGIKSGGYKQTAWSPKFGLVYQLVKDHVSLFGNYQNGFKNQPGADFAGNAFKPEQANQIEGGVKLDVFDGKLSSTLSYYDIKVKDILRADPAHPNFSIQNGTQVSKGLEAEVIANPLTGLNVVAGFAYNDSKYINSSADVDGLRPGVAGSPYTANLWVSYRLQAPKLKGLGVGFGGNYTSDNKVINSRSQGVFILPSYTILNSTVFYDKGVYRIGLSCNNFTNKEYYTGYSSVNPQMLRQYLASFAFRF
ncbi:TonB-dependent receptor [Mucilaginibacter agri]|uniref:TonB-dependent siderophore receptor n=1 Tax=Mucilaginibacter agri TaxID=2695265 RepID=A0A965ZIE1_9SPHI|nr:TonB-dependent receptor [Mucilaginibacter agri]NCD70292.1 TonB-dependent siderophore receptor [Mucilaginibacter agri]